MDAIIEDVKWLGADYETVFSMHQTILMRCIGCGQAHQEGQGIVSELLQSRRGSTEEPSTRARQGRSKQEQKR